MSQLLILAAYHSAKGRCLTAHDLATACAAAELRTVLLDLTPRPPRSRQRGRAGSCGLPYLLAALSDDAADLGQMASSTRMPGLSVLAARPSPADDAGEPDAVSGLFTTVIKQLLAVHDRVVVASPPLLDGLQAARLFVVPSHAGRCDVLRDVIGPLRAMDMLPDKKIADTPDLLVVTVVADGVRPCIPEEMAPIPSTPGDGVITTSAPEADADDVVTRCYYLSAEAIGSLKVFARTLSDRTGAHITLSELVAVAVRTSRILDGAEQLGRQGPGQARTFYLRRSTLNHLSQLALLASRALGRHVRLSEIVDLAIRLLCARPLDEQVELLEANRRKREHRA